MKYIFLLTLVAYAGCSLPQENNFKNSVLQYAEVTEASAVSDCLAIERVIGKNKRTGILAPTGEIIAMKIVTAKAVARGGTHVVIEDNTSNDESIVIKGQAYDCSEKAKSEFVEELALDNPEELDLLED